MQTEQRRRLIADINAVLTTIKQYERTLTDLRSTYRALGNQLDELDSERTFSELDSDGHPAPPGHFPPKAQKKTRFGPTELRNE